MSPNCLESRKILSLGVILLLLAGQVRKFKGEHKKPAAMPSSCPRPVPAIHQGVEPMTLRAFWWILVGNALPVLALEDTAVRADQALFFTSDKLDRDDPGVN